MQTRHSFISSISEMQAWIRQERTADTEQHIVKMYHCAVPGTLTTSPCLTISASAHCIGEGRGRAYCVHVLSPSLFGQTFTPWGVSFLVLVPTSRSLNQHECTWTKDESCTVWAQGKVPSGESTWNPSEHRQLPVTLVAETEQITKDPPRCMRPEDLK